VAEKARNSAKCAYFHENVAFHQYLLGIYQISRISTILMDFRISGRNQPQKRYGIPLVYQGLGGFVEDHCHRRAFFVITTGI